MKYTGRTAAQFLADPKPEAAGILLYGADAVGVGLKRDALVAALIGPDGPGEMRLTRIAVSELRRDRALVNDAIRAVGFFPGPRVVRIDEAGDAQAEVLRAALGEWRSGDAQLVVTAGTLAARSALRRVFEADHLAVAIGLYDDPPGREAIATGLEQSGIAAVAPDAVVALEELGRGLEPGDYAQLVAKLAIYKLGDPQPLSVAEVKSCAPPDMEADLDEVLDLAAEGKAADLPAALRRLAGQGGNPTTIAIAASRHFRLLHAAAVSGEGTEVALSHARPPVFGPRRTRMAAQARAFGPARLERALGWVMDTDLALRSPRSTPGMAMVERMLVRIAMLGSDQRQPAQE